MCASPPYFRCRLERRSPRRYTLAGKVLLSRRPSVWFLRRGAIVFGPVDADKNRLRKARAAPCEAAADRLRGSPPDLRIGPGWSLDHGHGPIQSAGERSRLLAENAVATKRAAPSFCARRGGTARPDAGTEDGPAGDPRRRRRPSSTGATGDYAIRPSPRLATTASMGLAGGVTVRREAQRSHGPALPSTAIGAAASALSQSTNGAPLRAQSRGHAPARPRRPA